MNHEMKLNNGPFERIKNGTKTIELRLNDEKRSLIKLNDVIKFKNEVTNETFEVKVVALLRYNSFNDLFDDFDIEVLADKEMTKKELLDVLEQFYTKEKQEKYGVLGIKIQKF
jgi:ASC-1-like (ASCH) protein